MNLLKNWRSFFGGHKIENTVEQRQTPEQQIISDQRYGPIGIANIPVNERTALSYPALFCGLHYICNLIARIDLDFIKVQPNGHRTKDRTDPFWYLMNVSPNEEVSSFSHRYAECMQKILIGNSYSEIAWQGLTDKVDSLWLLNPYDVTPTRDELDRLIYKVANTEKPFLWTDIIHQKHSSMNGYKGVGIKDRFKDTISLQLALEQQAAYFFANSNRSSGFYSSESGFGSEEEIKHLKETLDEANNGVANTGKTLLLNNIKWNPVSNTPEESQMLQSRQHCMLLAAQMLGLVPTKVGDYSRANWATLEQNNLSVILDCLTPLAEDIASEYTLKLVPRQYRTTNYFEHDFASLLRGDNASQAAYFTQGRNGGWFNANEIRSMIGINRRDDDRGDVYLEPMNMSPPTTPTPTVDPPAIDKPTEQEPIETDSEVKNKDVVSDQSLINHRSAFDALFAHEVGRLYRRETAAVTNSVKKAKTVEEFRDATNEFYSSFANFARHNLAPAISAATVANPDVNKHLEPQIRQWVDNHQNDINELCDVSLIEQLPSSVEILLTTWENPTLQW